MSEWIKANQSWLVILSMIVLFLMIIGIVVDFQKSMSEIRADYVTQTRYYNYNKEQDATTERLQDQVTALGDQLSDTRVDVASNTAKLDLIINNYSK